ncbi:polyprenyl diphosphate synthase [Flagellatimonas centrodinii]|uniref:polyprenyl diphosphate synthase n=1 Tax=Flagellatimonas centrodinii TaxID=2806210 RepID=UPI001FEF3203|nr:polyprenyl diphosphate synthase [Flagellatimonas centrodinii]ULQ46118.1 polyprenyl diphosphate synthase [Flagellatimonas centrodinii]
MSVPSDKLPRHVAVIMDGNGRWAQHRGEARGFGHRAGVEAARGLMKAAAEYGIEVLTVYAFSQENWQRPGAEVALLMQLFSRALDREVAELHANNLRLRFIGDRSRFEGALTRAMGRAEALTAGNTGMTILIAIGYSGQWELVQAAERCRLAGTPVTVSALAAQLETAGLPDVDLLIRSGGEHRISNFLLWQSAYAELYFTDQLWPDFNREAFDAALHWYAARERRFGGLATPGDSTT